MKKQSGITLVSLVITIIVMLILAGVSISLVVGDNGVLTQASTAVVSQKAGEVRDAVSTALAAVETRYMGGWATNTSLRRADVYDEYLKDELSKLGYTVTSTFDVTTANTVTMTNAAGEKFEFATITVNANTGATTYSGTLTIKDSEGEVLHTVAL